jgi:hypothetical protein
MITDECLLNVFFLDFWLFQLTVLWYDVLHIIGPVSSCDLTKW